MILAARSSCADWDDATSSQKVPMSLMPSMMITSWTPGCASTTRSKRGSAVGGLLHLQDALPHRGGIPQAVQQELGMAFHDHEQVVEIVRHASGQFAHGLHLLRLTQLVGEAVALGIGVTRFTRIIRIWPT